MIKILAAAAGVVLLEAAWIWKLRKDKKTLSLRLRTANQAVNETRGKIDRLNLIMQRIGEIEKERRQRNEEIDIADGDDLASILSNRPEDSGD